MCVGVDILAAGGKLPEKLITSPLILKEFARADEDAHIKIRPRRQQEFELLGPTPK